MKKFIALLLIGLLLISCSGCDKAPKGESNSEVAMSEADDGVDMQTDNIIEKTIDVPKVETVQPKQPENKKEPQPYNLNYTVKHDDSIYILGYTEDDMPQFPKVYVINSVQKLLQVIEGGSVSYRFHEEIRYREKTDATLYDYSQAKQEARITEYYNDAFFENKILIIVISKIRDYDTVADLNLVKSDGTVQINLLNTMSRNYKTYSISCCDYIELDKKYAGLNFKVKYNEVTTDQSIETRAPLPEYPKSINFKATQFKADGLTDEYISKYNGIVLIKSVEDFKNYFDTMAIIAIDNLIEFNMTAEYDYSNKNRIAAHRSDKFYYRDYYNEKLFKNKCIVVIPVVESGGSIRHEVRSITDEGTIFIEEYIQGIDTCHINYGFEFIEINKQYENLEFKTEFVKIAEDEYKFSN